MLHRFSNEIIPLGSGMETYLCWCLQTITGSYSKHSSPSAFWPYLRNIAFLTETTEKINWSSILRIQSTYHSCKPKNTHLLNDPALYFIVIKCGKEAISLIPAAQLNNSPDPSSKNRPIFHHQYIKLIKHLWGLSSTYGSALTTFIIKPLPLYNFFLP